MRSYDTAAVFRKSILTKDNPESIYVCVMVTLAALAKADPSTASTFNYSLIDVTQIAFTNHIAVTTITIWDLGTNFLRATIHPELTQPPQ